eukprot:TRINITY_DN39038_c0_g1_i1.p1 TRINITY_DN39038_c0_g1~~TRINITY_DN39038_c0_g1_i1.p1  ORF type:complete len:214 (-),score=15.01 TRINITY_DN39038_c0_g1_i1:350-904(-)
MFQKLTKNSLSATYDSQVFSPIAISTFVRQFCSSLLPKNCQEWKPVTWDVRMLYDGECPLCVHEVNFLKRRDQGKNKIDFVDISLTDYSPEQNQGVTYEQGMGRMHGILADGKVVRDIEVFRHVYKAVGLGWLFAATENKYIEYFANQVYGFWAKYRMQITGRPGLEVVFEKRRTQGQMCRKEE